MGFWHPDNMENRTFSYNVLMTSLCMLSAGVWQQYGLWLPFVFSFTLYAFIAWQLYVVPLLTPSDEKLSEEDKNRISYHEALKGNISRAEEKAQGLSVVVQKQTQHILAVEEQNKELAKRLEKLENRV